MTIKIFYTSRKYKENWDKVFGKDEPLVAEKDYKDLYGYGLPDWQDIVFKPNSFDNFCIKHNLFDGYGDFFTKEKEEEEMDLKTKVLDVISDLCDDVVSFTSLDVSNRVKQEGFADTRHRQIAPVVRQAYMDGELDFFGYSRTLISVTLNNGQTTNAFLYHHQSVDPDSYDKLNQIAIIPVATPAPAADADDDDYSPVKFDPDPDDAQQAFDSALANKSDAQKAFDNALAAKQDMPSSSDVTASAPRVVNTTPVAAPTSNDGLLDTADRETTYEGRMEVPAGWVPRMGWTAGNAVYAILNRDKIIMKTSVVQGENVVGTMYINSDGRLRLTKMASVNAGWRVTYGLSRKLSRFADRIEVECANHPAPPPAPTSTFCF